MQTRPPLWRSAHHTDHDVTAANEETTADARPVRARLDKFETLDAFVEGYSQYFSRGGMLLPTRNPREVGSTISLQLEIRGGVVAVRAVARVDQVRTATDGSPVGMVLRFVETDEPTRALVNRILGERKQRRTAEHMAVGATPAAGSPVVPSSAGSAPVQTTTAEAARTLASDDLHAIADALDETFDSIFGGNTGSSAGGFGDIFASSRPGPTAPHSIVPQGGALAADPYPAPEAAPAGDSPLDDAPFGHAPTPSTHDGPALSPSTPDQSASDVLEGALAGLFDEPTNAVSQDAPTNAVAKAVAPPPMPPAARNHTMMGMRAFDLAAAAAAERVNTADLDSLDDNTPVPQGSMDPPEASGPLALGRIPLVRRAVDSTPTPIEREPGETGPHAVGQPSHEAPPPSGAVRIVKSLTGEFLGVPSDDSPKEDVVGDAISRLLSAEPPPASAAQADAGETALDALLAAPTPGPRPLPPTPSSTSDELDVPVGLFARLIAWFKRLFGG